jgi:hypothetical protein
MTLGHSDGEGFLTIATVLPEIKRGVIFFQNLLSLWGTISYIFPCLSVSHSSRFSEIIPSSTKQFV